MRRPSVSLAVSTGPGACRLIRKIGTGPGRIVKPPEFISGRCLGDETGFPTAIKADRSCIPVRKIQQIRRYLKLVAVSVGGNSRTVGGILGRPTERHAPRTLTATSFRYRLI